MSAITEAHLVTVIESLRGQYPALQLITKSSLLPGSTRCTTVGQTLYVPTGWDSLAPAVRFLRLQHEAVHLAQFAQYGTRGFLMRYALPAWRWAYEQAAYQGELTACAQVYSVGTLLARRDHYIDQMAGRSYYWMASETTIAAWVDDVIAACLRAEASEDTPHEP